MYPNRVTFWINKLKTKWFSGSATHISLDSVCPIFLLPFLGYLATLSFMWTFFIFLSLPILISYAHYLFTSWFPYSKFFFVWTITSILVIYATYQFVLLPLQIISSVENIFFFIILLGCIWRIRMVNIYAPLSHVTSDFIDDDNNDCSKITASESEPALHVSVCSVCKKQIPPRTYHCSICHVCILERDLHCMWFDCCIGLYNRRTYLGALVVTIVWLMFTSYLMLTAVCHPVIIYDSFLVPNDCSEVYSQITLSICFICGIYCMISAMIPLALMVHEIWMISIGVTGHEWRLLKRKQWSFCGKVYKRTYDRGTFKNWLYFLRNKS